MQVKEDRWWHIRDFEGNDEMSQQLFSSEMFTQKESLIPSTASYQPQM